MTHRWLVLVLLFAACTDFDSVARGVCGNGLLEPGEDCDSGDASCVRCAVTCSAPADCPDAESFTCGIDGFCHAPGGELAQPTAPVTFQADDLQVTDIDHDGAGDVLGVSRTSIIVRYGDAGGSLTASDSFVTPPQSGPPAFGDLDRDGSTDVTLSTPDGLVTYRSTFGMLSPVDIQTPIYDGISGEPLDIQTVFSVGPQQLGAFVIDHGIVVLAVVSFGGSASFVAPCVTRLGPIQRANLAIASVDVYKASRAPAPTTQLVVSFVTTSGALCVSAISGTPAAGYTITDVTPAGIVSLQHRPVLVDLDSDADPCPALVNSDGGPAALRQWDGKLVGGRCTLEPGGATGTALPPIANAPSSAVAIGRIPIDPPILVLSSDAIVLSSGVYAHVPGFGMGTLYASPRTITKVAYGDLDRDGDVDAVLAPDDEDDLDMLYRFPEGLELLRLDTASQATSLTIGDFDGNAVNDIAFTETGSGHQNMMIAYGTADRPLPPAQVATFSDVASITPFELPNASDLLSIADDLFVIQPSVAGALPTMSLLHGSPQRTMLSFFDPRAEDVRGTTIVRGAIVGDFVATAEARADLLVIAAPELGQQALGMRAWRVAGAGSHLDSTPSSGLPASGVVDCRAGTTTGVCAQDALYLAWPQAPERDVVFAVDRGSSARAVMLDPWAGPTSLAATPIPMISEGIPTGASVQSMYATDLDGDAAPELVISFATRAGMASPTGSVRVCHVDGGIPTSCEDLAPTITAAFPEVTSCIDAAPGRIGASATPDLVVLCRGAATSVLVQVSHEAAGYRATMLAQAPSLRALRIGDVTGDGVHDVVAVQGDIGASSLVVFPQCTSRGLATCRGTAAGAGGDE